MPAELRNRIYDLAIVEDNKIDVREAKVQPAIAQTCRQIRQETKGSYIAKNTFVAHVEENKYEFLLLWLKALTAQDIQNLRKLIISCDRCFNWNRKGIFVRMDIWHHIVYSLTTFKLKPLQVSWTGALHACLTPKHPDPLQLGKAVGEVHVFNKFVLRPLLSAHHLLNDAELPSQLNEVFQIATDMAEYPQGGQEAVTLCLHMKEQIASIESKAGIMPLRWYRMYIMNLARNQGELHAAVEEAEEALQQWNDQNNAVLMSDVGISQGVFEKTVRVEKERRNGDSTYKRPNTIRTLWKYTCRDPPWQDEEDHGDAERCGGGVDSL